MHNSIFHQRIYTVTQAMVSIEDDKFKAIKNEIFNIFEDILAAYNDLRNENQQLKNEINISKGEQGKPSIRKQPKKNIDHSSEKERRKNKAKKTKNKKQKKKINIDSIEICELDKSKLPEDAIKKGYKTKIIQNLKIETDNIEFKREVYYSPSLKKTFIAELPEWYSGGFSPDVKALALDLHASAKMTHSAIHRLFTTHGLLISSGKVSGMLTDDLDDLHQEKQNIIEAGLSSSIYQQMDDTGAKEIGKNKYTHILCNEHYTAYFTKPDKSRLTIINILSQDKIQFCFNRSSYELMKHMQVPGKYLNLLKSEVNNKSYDRTEADKLLNDLFPELKQRSSNRRKILDASSLVAYRQLEAATHILLTDDAPQYRDIAKHHALCWVHDGRHYKKLNPIILDNKNKLKDFLKKYWDFYRKLLLYKQEPTDENADLLSREFDDLFSTITGYDELDKRIQRTKLKKINLLLVLEYPELPLHNNGSELGARVQARYRDISFHTINPKGTKAKDTLMTIIETAKKLGVNSYQYLCDRISKKYSMPALHVLIKTRTSCFG